MSNPYMYLAAIVCLISFACDDEQSKSTERIPQINLAGSETDLDASTETNTQTRCEHTFMYASRGSTPNEVKVAGTFEMNPWSGQTLLTDDDQDGTWIAQIDLAEGLYEYKFIIDGQWRPDLDQADTIEDGVGGFNSRFQHRCPSLPECLSDTDCELSETALAQNKTLCRGTVCVDSDQAILCSQCQYGCEVTGECSAAPPVECDAEIPCPSPFICEEGRCVPECQSDEDCQALDNSALCLDLACVIPECESDDECDLLDESCEQYLCVPRACNEVLFIFDPAGEQYDRIHIAGEFNANAEGIWPESVEAGGWPMSRLPDGRYFGRYVIENGVFAYKFVLHRGTELEWVSDPQAMAYVDDGFGGQNSILEQACEETASSNQCGDLNAFQWEDAVMYFVIVDRFYDSDGQNDPVPYATEGNANQGASGQYEGGDINGVSQKLPYLQELGVNALWLSAPYENRDLAGSAIDPNRDPHTYSAYHGYWPSPENIDYSDLNNPSPRPQVESRIGDEAGLKSLIEQAHNQDVKILFDYVMNHVDSESGLAQAHPNWFARRENGQIALCGPENLWDDQYWGTRCAFTDYLPPFDFAQAEARAWSVNDALWWAEEFNIDGYRLDAIKHVPLNWLEDLRLALNQRITEPQGGRFYLVGETFAYDNAELIRDFINPETLLDGQFDFPFKARLCEALFRPEGRLDGFASWMNQNDRFYGEGALMTTWIGNHDIPRAIHFASREIENCREGSSPENGWTMSYPQPNEASAYQRLALAFGVMMTNPGIPLIYYGDEIGLAGGGDPDNRRMMPWNHTELLPAQIELRNRVTRLTQLRKQYPNLSRGRRVTLSADQDTWVYRMLGCGQDTATVTVMINRSDLSKQVNLPVGSYRDVLNEESVSGGMLSIEARNMRILIDEQ